MKLFFAIGYEAVEKHIENEIKGKARVVGYTLYREGIEKGVLNTNPDVIIIRETLTGSKNMLEIIYSLRKTHPNLRIIFIAGDRKPGDEMLSEIVNLGIYDIIVGGQINLQDLIDYIFTPRTFKDVSYLKVKTLIDEKSNKKVFEAPEGKKEIKTVYIEKEVEVKQDNTVEDKNSKEDNLEDKATNNESVETPKVEGGFNFLSKLKGNKTPKVKDKEPNLKDKDNNSNKNRKVQVSKQMIITFIGGKSGVGTSQISFNTAINLAQKGYKTLYINLDENISSVDFIFQLGLFNKGIDTAIKYINKNINSYLDIQEAIIDIDKVMKINSEDIQMIKNYKKYPKNLKYMFFSRDYGTSTIKEKLDSSGLKDICMYALLKEQYEVVVIDTCSDINNEFTKVAIELASKVFFTITQDVSTISSLIAKHSLINKNRINLNTNFYYILNKYENAHLTTKDISNWIKKDINVVIPNINRDFINSNYIGIPLILGIKNKEVVNAFQQIYNITIN